MVKMFRRLVAALGIAALLFMQIAVSAYACALEAPPAVAAESTVQGAPGCDELDDVASLLCHSHCNPQAQSADKAHVPDIAQPVALKFMPAWRSAETPQASVVPACHRRTLALPPERPLAIRNCCFRL